MIDKLPSFEDIVDSPSVRFSYKILVLSKVASSSRSLCRLLSGTISSRSSNSVN